MDEPYEVALSFAGEDRAYVDQVAVELQGHGVRVFYDSFRQADLWGRDLGEFLADVYGHARYTVMFVSEAYIRKEWTRHERRSALERAITEQVDSVLPARFDDVDVPGLARTVGHIDLRKTPPSELVRIVLQKLGRDGAPAQRQAELRPDVLDILRRVGGDREALVRIACTERLTVGWLDGLLSTPHEHLLPVLRQFAQSADNEWQYKLAGLLAKRVGPPAFDMAIEIARDGSAAWGPRTTVLSWLRHASGAERARLSASAHAIGASSDFDALRLRIVAYGYLGDRSALRHLAKTEDVTGSRYASEKLGSYLAEAYLNAYVHRGDEMLGGSDLDDFARHVESAQELSHYGLGFFDYAPRVASLLPGRAAPVLDVALRLGDEGLLDAVLFRLSEVPNPYLADRLAGLASDGHPAAMALAFIGTDRSAAHLDRLADAGVAGAGAGAVLAVGVRNDQDGIARLTQALEQADAMVATYAAWSFGCLARAGSQLAIAALRGAVEGHPHGLVRATAVAGLTSSGGMTTADLQEHLALSETFVERVTVGVAGAWLADAGAVEAGLLATVRHAAPMSWLEAPLHRMALDALGSRSEGPFDLLNVLAQEPLIT